VGTNSSLSKTGFGSRHRIANPIVPLADILNGCTSLLYGGQTRFFGQATRRPDGALGKNGVFGGTFVTQLNQGEALNDWHESFINCGQPITLSLDCQRTEGSCTARCADILYSGIRGFSGTDHIYLRGTSNLPTGAHLVINIYGFVGQGSSVLNQDTQVTIGKDGFFEVKISPKSEVKFRSNLVCEVIFMPTFPAQEPSVLRAVGMHGEKLNSSGKNPQAKTASGGYYLSELIHIP
jgi:hypothetical protein